MRSNLNFDVQTKDLPFVFYSRPNRDYARPMPPRDVQGEGLRTGMRDATGKFLKHAFLAPAGP